MPPTSTRPAARTAVASRGGKYGSHSGFLAHAGNIATAVAASTPYGARAGSGNGGVSNKNQQASTMVPISVGVFWNGV